MFDLMPFEMGKKNLRNFFDEFDKRLFKDDEFSLFCTDIIDKNDKFILKADLPGFEKSDIKIDIDDDLLTISAEQIEETKEENNNKKAEEYYIHRERRYGTFSRSFHVANIDVDKIEASYCRGVLTLTLPKKHPDASNPKQIKIK